MNIMARARTTASARRRSKALDAALEVLGDYGLRSLSTAASDALERLRYALKR